MSAALIHASVSLLRDLQNPKEQYSPRCNTEDASVVVETADSAPSATANDTEETLTVANDTEETLTVANDTEETLTVANNDAPTAPAHAWRYTAMSAAAFTLSALLTYIATEAICKRVRGRN